MGTQDHLPYGEDAGFTGESGKHRFTNNERDAETGTDQAVNRQHQSANGRFMQPDVVGGGLGDPRSLNRYAYSLNDPGNVTDPSGLDPIVHFINLNPPPQFDASNPGPGIYWDGIRVDPPWYRFVFGVWSSGAAVIAPFGAKAFYGAGGTTFVELPSYYYNYTAGQPVPDTMVIGVMKNGMPFPPGPTENIKAVMDCYNKWKFSGTIAGLVGEEFRGIAEAFELGSLLSLGSDIPAVMKKSQKPAR